MTVKETKAEKFERKAREKLQRKGKITVKSIRHHDTSLQEDLMGQRANSLVKKHSILSKTASMLSGKREPIQEYMKKGRIKKLTSHDRWVPKSISLSDTELIISDASNRNDYIPLHEMTSIVPSNFKVAHDHLTKTGSGLTHSSLRGGASPEPQKSPLMSASPGRNFMRIKTSSSMFKQTPSKKTDKNAGEGNDIFDVFTTADGLNSGRKYTFKADSPEECQAWIDVLRSTSEQRLKVILYKGRLQEWRDKTRKFYKHSITQTLIAFLIFLNFSVVAHQAEYDPMSMQRQATDSTVYTRIELCLTGMFLLELVTNLFANWFKRFWSEAWNWFDFVMVTISIVSLVFPAIPGILTLRVLRAFRLIRLIRRFKSLTRIFHALVLSIIPVLNAFFIGVLMTLIYTIIGVFLFMEQSPQHFGTFNRSMITLFMLTMTGAWPDDELPMFTEEGNVDVTVFLFLFSFVAVVLWTCLQVVVAVLLDNFLGSTQDEKRAENLEMELANTRISPLDPLLQKLIDSFATEEGLKRDIFAVFQILDVDNSGAVTNQEMVEGFAKLQLVPRIRLSPDDCQTLKEDALESQDEDAELNSEEFEQVMRVQLHQFIQRRMHAAFVNNQEPSVAAILGGLKLSLLTHDNSAQDKIENLEKSVAGINAQLQTLTHGLSELLGKPLIDPASTLLHSNPSTAAASAPIMMHSNPLPRKNTGSVGSGDSGHGLGAGVMMGGGGDEAHKRRRASEERVRARGQDGAREGGGGSVRAENGVEEPAGGQAAQAGAGGGGGERDFFEVVDTEWLRMAHERVFARSQQRQQQQQRNAGSHTSSQSQSQTAGGTPPIDADFVLHKLGVI